MTRFAVVGWTEGRSSETNQDAFRFRSSTSNGRMRLDIAVADGATTTLYAGQWAAELADAAVSGWATQADEEVTAALEGLRKRFDPLPKEGLTDRFRARKWRELGSQATVLSASVVDSGQGGQLRAVAVGDCELLCLHRHGVSGFPLETSADFTNTPELVTSRQGDGVTIVRWGRALERGDVLLLATDAVAHHLMVLAEEAGGMAILGRLRSLLASGESPGALSSALLDQDGARFDDDATLVLCGVTSGAGGDDRQVLASLVDGLLGIPREPWVERAAQSVGRWLHLSQRPRSPR